VKARMKTRGGDRRKVKGGRKRETKPKGRAKLAFVANGVGK